MYKVVIADDEKKICQLLQLLIDWKAMNMQIVGIAHNGQDALSMILQSQPDIVIADIRMPEYGGLELIKEVKERYPGIDFIIMSGHRQFEYARKALHYGAEDYLLKPIKEAELVRCLNRIIERKQALRTDLEHRQKQEQTVLEQARRLSGVFVRDLVLGKIDGHALNKETIRSDYKCDFSYTLFQVVCIRIDAEDRNVSLSELDQIMEKRTEFVLEQNFGSLEWTYSFCFIDGLTFIVVNLADTMLDTLVTQLRHGISDIKNMSDSKMPLYATIGLSDSVNNSADLPMAVIQARDAVTNRLIYGVDQILRPFDRKDIDTVNKYLTLSVRKRLGEGIESLNESQVKADLRAIFDAVLSAKHYDGKLLINLSKEIIELFLHASKVWFFNEAVVQMKKEAVQRIDACFSKESLLAQMSETTSELFEAIYKQRDLREKRPIHLAKEYIKTRYQLPVSLDEVAEHLALNAAYFSSIFKKETGISFSEYLTSVRIDKAKELLLEANRTVFDVASSVGYDDEKYFSRVFKKSVGLSPSEYRKLYS